MQKIPGWGWGYLLRRPDFFDVKEIEERNHIRAAALMDPAIFKLSRFALVGAPGLRRENTKPYFVTASVPMKPEEKICAEVLSRLPPTALRLKLAV